MLGLYSGEEPKTINEDMKMLNLRRLICLVCVGLMVGGIPYSCSERHTESQPVLYVSILPLRDIVHRLVGDDFRVEVLVPAGASPETFEPSARQFVELNRAEMLFNVGLIPFERALLSKVEDQRKIVALSDGIELIEGACGHNHVHGEAAHGVDPHVWTSPRALRQMAENAFRAIQRNYPDSTKYESNYAALQSALQELDETVARKIAVSDRKSFIVYHPALTYYARDYGLKQVSIEEDGKEPSARRMSRLIEYARKEGIKHIFCQKQFPVSTVQIIADDMDGEVVMFDPLSEDVVDNILKITDLILQ